MRTSGLVWLVPVLGGSLGALGCGGSAPTAEEHAQAVAQNLQAPSSTSSAQASYSYPIPEGWTDETDPTPPPWFPEFPWSGTELLRFTPGFPDAQSPEWWSYDYLFWVESGPKVTAAALQDAMINYYKGLVSCGTQLPCDPSRFAGEMHDVARLGSLGVFQGHVDTYDFSPMPVPFTLNLLITSFECPASKHRGMLVSASPQPANSPIWAELLDAQLQFRCN